MPSKKSGSLTGQGWIIFPLAFLASSVSAQALITTATTVNNSYNMSDDVTITSTGSLIINSPRNSSIINNSGTLTIDGGTVTAIGVNKDAFFGRGGGRWGFNVINGGNATLGSIGLAAGTGAYGSALIDGQGSQVTGTRVSIGFGTNASATLTLSNGGSLTGTEIIIGRTGSGTLNIGAAPGTAAQAPGFLKGPVYFGLAGSGVGSGTLVFNHTSQDYTFSSNISSVTQDGSIEVLAGTTHLTGLNTGFRGRITIDGGTLVGSSSSLGTGQIVNNALLVLDQAQDGISSNLISGSGALEKTGLGTSVLTAANTYAGGTTINTGTLQVGNGSANGSIVGDVIDNSTLAFNRADSITFNGMISGGGNVQQNGSGSAILTGDSTYTGGTTINAGTLQLGSGGASGSIVGDVTDNGTLAFNRSDAVAFNGAVSGAGNLQQNGGGSTILTATNTYTGGTAINAGTLQLGNGGASGSIVGDVTDNGTLAFNRTDTVSFNGLISGAGGVQQSGAGVTVLAGVNSYTGATDVTAGSLYINGDQSGATGATTVGNGATLGGMGTIGGSVTVVDGGSLAPGGNVPSPGILTIHGNLGLGAGSVLNYGFGQTSVPGAEYNELTNVGGNLTLAGTLNIVSAPGGNLDPGVYRLFNYGGTLTNNGLTLGTIPLSSSSFFVQTSVANQVNLINAAGLTLKFWDGDAGPKNNGGINGGNGTWQSASGNDNWTDVNATVNAPYADRSFAVFDGAAGKVTVDNSIGNVSVEGMQFASNGYLVEGDTITLAGSASDPTHSIIRVGDDTAEGVGYIATINNVLTGASELVKTDEGTLVLGGANTYTGGTSIEDGVLQVSSDTNLGAATGGLSFDEGTLRTTADMTSNRVTTLDTGGGTLDTASGTTFTLGGVIGGVGGLTKTGAGTTVLTGANIYSGGTTISAGTLQVGNGSTSGSIVGNVTDNGTLAFNRADTITFSGVISGTGSVQQNGSGGTILSGTHTYTGGTTINAGTLQLGNGSTSGSIVGDVSDNGTLVFNRSDTVVFGGMVSGTGNLQQGGSGTTVLNGMQTYTGTTTISDGTLVIGDASHAGAALTGGGTTIVSASSTLGGYGKVAGDVANAGTLAVANALPAYAGSALGGFTIGSTLTNASLVQLAAAEIGNTLTVTNYNGQNGRIALNAVLNGDGSPADRIVINGGSATGSSTLLVNNVGGLGAPTPGNGIPVVNTVNRGSTNANAFELGNRLIAGPYEYTLYRGGRDGGTPNDWYLRSEVDTSANLPLDGGTASNYRLEVSTYTALSSMMANFGRSTLGTLDDRVGERSPTDKNSDDPNSAWARVIGQDGKWDAKSGGIYHDGPSFDDNFVAVQVGSDLFHEEKAGGSGNRAGLYAVAGHGYGNVENYDGSFAGNNKFDAYSLGVYWTHYAANGAYADVVLQGTWYENVRAGTQLTTDGFGVAASVEGGYPFQLSSQWRLEPQVQLIYQGISVDDSHDTAADVRFGNVNSVAGRAGARLARTWMFGEGMHARQLDLWLRGNVWHEFSANPKTELSSETGYVPFQSNLKGSWYEITAGVNARVSRATSLYANLGYQKGINQGIQAVNGAVGVRVNW